MTIASITTSLALERDWRRLAILVHHSGDESLIQRSPIHANANRLIVFERYLDDGPEVIVMLPAHPDVAGINTIFVERSGAVWILVKENVPVVVEITNQRTRGCAGPGGRPTISGTAPAPLRGC